MLNSRLRRIIVDDSYDSHDSACQRPIFRFYFFPQMGDVSCPKDQTRRFLKTQS